MDFSKLETKTGAEKGAFLHLKHPAFGTLLWDIDADTGRRKAVGLWVRGTESKTVQDRLKAKQRRLMAAKEDAEDTGLDFVVSLVMDWQGIDLMGKPAEFTEENARLFFNLSDSFVEQAIAFATDRASFFTSAENG